jgi:hypothetical protein
MTALPYLLLATTLSVRALLMVKDRRGWWLDIATIPAWVLFYVSAEAWPLIAIPFVFGALDVRALRGAWRHG